MRWLRQLSAVGLCAIALSACFGRDSGGSGPGATFDAGFDGAAFDASMELDAAPPDAVAPPEAAAGDGATDALTEAGPVDLGRVWHELEENGKCSGLWTRQGPTSSFASVWGNCNGTTAVMIISIVGTAVTVQRTMDSGGNDCTYTGTLSADALSVTGTYKCVLYQPPPPGAWSATIDYGTGDAGTDAGPDASADAPSGG